MKNKTASRGPSIDNDKCVELSGGNRFNHVIMAAARARELTRQHKNSGSTEHFNAPVSAILDFQNGKIGPEYIKRVR